MKAKISEAGRKFLREGNITDLYKAIHNQGSEGKFESNGKTYKFSIIGSHTKKDDTKNS